MLDRYLKICSIQIVVLDFIGLNAIFYMVRSWLGQTGEPINVDVDTFLIGANIAWMIALYTTGIYFVSQQLSYERVARKTVQGILLYLLLLLGYAFMYKQLNSRSFIILYF
jgi:putative colanic acid biosynthesis UDP-glucose lipid carrier transferase